MFGRGARPAPGLAARENQWLRALGFCSVLALSGTLACSPEAAESSGSACEFSVEKHELSPAVPTVGVVEWSLSGPPPESAKVVYQLTDAADSTLNRGGTAPVDLRKPGFRTLLLGLKQARTYTFYIEATRAGMTCKSQRYELPRVGTLAEAPAVALTVAQAEKREPGFIVTSSGAGVPSAAYVIDSDGEVVWYFAGPQNLARAQLDYEGNTLWMLELNFTNEAGEMRAVSMDGLVVEQNVPGFETAHHDFTVMPGGRVAALAWSAPGIDPESDVVIRSPDGAVTAAFRVGSNLYRSDAYHANAIHYLPADDSFTIADRNPHAVVKVSAAGRLEWQVGGSCEGAPAGERCSPQSYEVVHGHHLLEDGTFLLFNNGYADVSHVLEFRLDEAPGAFAATLVKDYAGTAQSLNLGDAQRLPGENTLITYSSARKIVEVDAEWNEVQTFAVPAGYSSWRPTLYGPPARL